MPKLKKRKSKDFTIISNTMLRDKSLGGMERPVLDHLFVKEVILKILIPIYFSFKNSCPIFNSHILTKT